MSNVMLLSDSILLAYYFNHCTWISVKRFEPIGYLEQLVGNY